MTIQMTIHELSKYLSIYYTAAIVKYPVEFLEIIADTCYVFEMLTTEEYQLLCELNLTLPLSREHIDNRNAFYKMPRVTFKQDLLDVFGAK